jgi:AAA ATPase containing von Willebrand factor type A (vWA) domain
MSNEDIEKERKKLQKKEDPKNTAAQNAYDTAEQEAEDERDGIEDVKDAEAAYKNSNKDEKQRKAPPGWRNVGTRQEPELMTTKDAEKEEARREKVGAPDQKQMQKDADAADTKAKEDERKEQEKLGDAEMKARADAEKEKEDEEEPETTDDDETKDDEDEVEKDKDGNIKNQDDAQAAFEKGDFKKAPSGWTKDPEDETGKTIIKPEDKPKKPEKKAKKDDGFEKVGPGRTKKYTILTC